MNLYRGLSNKTQKVNYPNISIFIFLVYSMIMILVIPSFIKERILIISFVFDLIIRVFIVISLYQSIHFVLYFEQSITRFYEGAISFKLSDLNKERKILLVIYCILSGVIAYILLNYVLCFFIPSLGQFSKIFALIFGLYASIPIPLKMLSEVR